MWLLILAGFLAVSVGEETVSSAAIKTETSGGNVDDIVMLEIDVKEPAKRSPVSASGNYGDSATSQFVIRNADDAQELSPEYLSLLQQYTQVQPQAYTGSTNAPPPQRRPQPPYAKQQQALQQAYYNYRRPSVVPPRPRAQLHPQALEQAEANAQIQAHVEAQNRAEAIRSARVGINPSSASTYQVPSYSQPKLGTFEQELLQLVSANQAQEFKLLPTQPKGSVSPYSQQLVSYSNQNVKATPTSPQLPEQYHIETSPPRYHQPQQAAAYQAVEEPVQYQPVQQYTPKPTQAFRPSPQYDYAEEDPHVKAAQQAQAQAEAAAAARAQANAEAQALAFQKVTQAAHNKHLQDAYEQIRIVNERHRQQTALEQIEQGTQVSEAGRAHLEEQFHPKDPEAAHRARLKAQYAAETAEARRQQEASEFKAHADAIRKLEAQQQAHVKQQEQAHYNALNFERNQLEAQARAQALAQAQAEALYKVHLKNREKANKEVLAVAKAQSEARKLDPDNTPAVQYLLPANTPLPSPNTYLTSDQVQKYQGSGSSYVPRSIPKNENPPAIEQDQAYAQPSINQPRQTHKLKISPTSQSVYVSQSGLLKKSPVKSLTIEEVIQQDQVNGPQIVRIPTPKGHTITEEDLSALINAGYTVTPVPQTAKPTQQTYIENSSSAYYTKKQRTPVLRPEYATYEEVIQQPRKPFRKNRPLLKHDEGQGEASEKVTYLVPLEPAFGTRQPPLRRDE